MRQHVSILGVCFLFIGLIWPHQASAKVWTVQVASSTFSPANLTVMAGDTVKWQWASGTHTTTSGSSCSASGLWDASITSSSPTFQRQFGTPGVYPYYCTFHCFVGMTGTISVEMVTGVLDGREGAMLPGGYALAQNYPNPFNANTVISYALSSTAEVSIDVFDILGRRVTTLVNERQAPGVYETSWDGRDDKGRDVASGTYFYRLRLGAQVYKRKMVMLK